MPEIVKLLAEELLPKQVLKPETKFDDKVITGSAAVLVVKASSGLNPLLFE